MEDAHAHVLSLAEETEGSDKKTSFFAVYDGHGGELFFSTFKKRNTTINSVPKLINFFLG